MTNLWEKTRAENTWPARQGYGMAVGCLLVGLVIGYLFRGSASPHISVAQQSAPTASAEPPQGHPMPTMEQMKAMGDKQAAPLLDKLKADPDNPRLLSQIGTIYKATHQFQEAEHYYRKALKSDPRNAELRGDLAACLYYTGDVEGAIAQLQQSLKNKPNDANSLFNLGVMKWQGKKDANGAIAAWHQLLKSNPKLEATRKTQVEQMIAEVGKGHQS